MFLEEKCQNIRDIWYFASRTMTNKSLASFWEFSCSFAVLTTLQLGKAMTLKCAAVLTHFAPLRCSAQALASPQSSKETPHRECITKSLQDMMSTLIPLSQKTKVLPEVSWQGTKFSPISVWLWWLWWLYWPRMKTTPHEPGPSEQPNGLEGLQQAFTTSEVQWRHNGITFFTHE